MKFIRRALVSAIAAVALIVGPAVSAEAAGTSFDVTKLSADNVVVSAWDCKKTNVSMKHKKSKVDDWDVETKIYGKHGLSDWADFSSYGGSTKDRISICPTSDGLGKYTLGPSEISAYYYGGYDYDEYGEVERADHTKGSFYVRGKSYASLAAKRSGKTVTLTSKTKVYNPEKYDKVSYSPKVKFQVKSGSKWKTIKTVTAKKGKATYKVKTTSKKTYRVTFSQVSWATGATSKSAKR
ncbi:MULTISPECIES: hypothetical protein [Brevibacterium]|uniref:Uncharacterized protein n=1 Tax=Brevibacterium antiquum CNRZ 918 TaxID=1255637 RepID=A0A2H1IFZ7_9MICO|nr:MULTISPECIES: hypothetical protein [Brevibacterium]SMX74071.1 hypothetical protein BANT918_00949 [Brevibacterium antiquum CNRZ 918]HCG56545.1 hypothetical protein [Brevibacterium sp.]